MTSTLPRFDVPHSAPQITHADVEAVTRSLRSGWIAQGAAAATFTEALRSFHVAPQVMLTSSGTSAIVLALRALGIGAGDEVVLPSYVCGSVRDAVLMSGGTPVLCDIGNDWRVNAETMQSAVTARTRALIAVDIFGLAADMDAFARLGLPIIDDRCQAFGLPRPQNSWVAFSTCSFHATKCLTAGEGGALVAWNDEAAQQLAAVAPAARRSLGVFSDLQATLALGQLEQWPRLLQRRTAIAERYLEALPADRTVAIRAAVTSGSVWFRFPVTLHAHEQFDATRARFATGGVQVRRGVDALLHRQAALPDRTFPNTVRAFDRTLSLPLWPAMGDAGVDHVIEVSAHVLGR